MSSLFHRLYLQPKLETDKEVKLSIAAVTGLTSGRFWIGMFDKEENWGWRWETNPRAVTWAKWATGFPKRKKDDCVGLVGGGFIDSVCTDLKTAICQNENASKFTFSVTLF